MKLKKSQQFNYYWVIEFMCFAHFIYSTVTRAVYRTLALPEYSYIIMYMPRAPHMKPINIKSKSRDAIKLIFIGCTGGKFIDTIQKYRVIGFVVMFFIVFDVVRSVSHGGQSEERFACIRSLKRRATRKKLKQNQVN